MGEAARDGEGDLTEGDAGGEEDWAEAEARWTGRATDAEEEGGGLGGTPPGASDSSRNTFPPTRRLKPAPTRTISAEMMERVKQAYPRLTAPLGVEFWGGIDQEKLGGVRRSRLTSSDLQEYIAAGVLIDADAPEAAPLFREACGAWVVPSGERWRLIVHPAASNARVAPVGFHMPAPRDLTRALARATSVLLFDYRSWYFQMGLPPHLLGAFGVTTMEGRRWCLSRTPMGASFSASVAEAVTRYVAGVAEEEDWGEDRDVFTYIDNTLVVNPDVDAWAGRVKGMELSEWRVVGTGERAKWIGVEFSLGPPVATRPSASIVAKWRRAVERARQGVREAAGRELAGLTVAVTERGQWPLAVAGRLIAPSQGPLSAEEEEGAAALERRLSTAGGWTTPSFPGWWVRGTSDASPTGWGVVLQIGAVTRSWAGSFRPGIHINIRELHAVERLVQLAPGGAALRVDVDNQVAVRWINTGNAGPKPAREALVRMHDTLVQKGGTLQAQWIPTSRNAADSLSRGGAFLGWNPPPWEPERQRRMLGGTGAPPDWATTE